MKQIITSILIFALASFASADIQPGKIIGTDDMIEVSGDGANLPEKLRPLVNAFGWTNYGCTVTHIGRGYVISDGHCFDGKDSIERGLTIRKARGTGSLETFLQKVKTLLHNNDINGAIAECNKQKGSVANEFVEG